MMYQGRLTDEQLDDMSEQMAENYKRMEQLAGTTDKEKRRKLMREVLRTCTGIGGARWRSAPSGS